MLNVENEFYAVLLVLNCLLLLCKYVWLKINCHCHAQLKSYWFLSCKKAHLHASIFVTLVLCYFFRLYL